MSEQITPEQVFQLLIEYTPAEQRQFLTEVDTMLRQYHEANFKMAGEKVEELQKALEVFCGPERPLVQSEFNLKQKLGQ